MEQPWLRKDWKKPELNLWVEQNRGLILSKLLIMASAWVQAGRPLNGSDKSIGNFENWSKIIGGILKFAGLKGFMGNTNKLYENLTTDDWTGFLTAWYNVKEYQSNDSSYLGMKTSEVIDMITSKPEFSDCIPEAISNKLAGRSDKDSSVIGKILKKQVEIVRSDGLKLVHVKDPHDKMSRWKIIVQESQKVSEAQNT